MRRQTFHKGHATGNDFVIIEDQYGMHDLARETVALLCDRHFGIGADGLLRVVRARHVEGWDGDPEMWFMDYRNSDGSVAEMCGNGLRLFARYLLSEQLAPADSFQVATRAGVRQITARPGGLITTGMGPVTVADDSVTVRVGEHELPATPVDVGNPHAVADVDAGTLGALELHIPPTWEPAGRFPDGTNIEFVVTEAPGRLRMRVHERGSGETLSCGTGVVAVAAVHRRRTGVEGPITVVVPGGELHVDFDDDQAWLTGTAVIIASGEYGY